jgi:nucleoid-associated protein EbfC
MFGDLLGNMQQQQADLQQKLSTIIVEAESGDGAIIVKAGADQHIASIKIDPSKLDMADTEQVEDLMIVAVNRALELAREKAGTETAQLLKGMFPFGDVDQFMKGG